MDQRSQQAQTGVSMPQSNSVRKLVILGATGSIGKSTADLICANPDGFEVVAIVGGRDVIALAQMALRLRAGCAVIADPSGYQALAEQLAGTNIKVGAGPAAVLEAAVMPCDLVVAAIVGTAGVAPTHAAIQQGRTIALANKETLVCAGYPVMADAARFGSQILPMDSEHNAIFQCLGQRALVSVEKLVLTASGGPFRTWSKEKIAAASRDQALAHPNWSMGPKVTVDSASLMNKGLELIEAHHIFEVDAKRLDVVVHPQSIVHGLVYFEDGAVTAGLAPPDMRVPIAHCLTYPDRLTTHVPRLDLTQIGQLTFEKPDFERFPCLGLALAALQQGGALPTILNAANEIAVEGFLSGQLNFSQIAGLVDQICQTLIAMGIDRRPDTVEEALAVDHITRERARAILAA